MDARVSRAAAGRNVRGAEARVRRPAAAARLRRAEGVRPPRPLHEGGAAPPPAALHHDEASDEPPGQSPLPPPTAPPPAQSPRRKKETSAFKSWLCRYNYDTQRSAQILEILNFKHLIDNVTPNYSLYDYWFA